MRVDAMERACVSVCVCMCGSCVAIESAGFVYETENEKQKQEQRIFPHAHEKPADVWTNEHTKGDVNREKSAPEMWRERTLRNK